MIMGSRETAVIIAAAGKGTRMGGPVPKQYMTIGGEPVLLKTIKVFSAIEQVDHIFIVAGDGYVEYCERLARENHLHKVKAVVRGGAERQDSVYNALNVIAADFPGVEYVLIHDGARPFVRQETVINVINAAAADGAAVACVPMKDSLRKTGEDGENDSCSVDRKEYFAVQTPQGFERRLLTDAYRRAFEEGFYGTDDAVLVERTGHRVRIVEGDYGNIKITTREDLPMEYRTGTGFDVHAFAEDRQLVLGGVPIPYEKGLAGHSDADVLVHAVMDALLGAAALGDIGRHFPDSDMQYKGISSMILLSRVRQLLEDNFYSIGNIDATVMAQAPKISPYVEQMRSGIAEALKIEKSRINIKGTTTERLGFVGRKEGIAAEAVCSIYR